MIVGAAVIELRVHGSRSLKEKRGVVRSVAQRLRNRFRVSVAEVGGQGSWETAVLGFSTVGIDPVEVRKVLTRGVDFVEDLHLAELVDSDIEILTLELAQDEPGVLWSDGDVADDVAAEDAAEGAITDDRGGE